MISLSPVAPAIPRTESREPLNRKFSNFNFSSSSHVEIEENLLHLTEQMERRMRQRKRLFILILICVILGFLTWLYIDHTVPEFNQYRLVKSYQTANNNNDDLTKDNNRPRTILLWNSFFRDIRWGFAEDTLGPSYFRDEMHCPIYNCELTNQENLLPAIQMFDAVLFHTAQPFPLVNSVPKKRNPRQQYIFALMEPPGETKHVLSDENQFYNLTMTYRLDSDIIWSYDWLVDKESGLKVNPADFPQWHKVPASHNSTEIWNLWPGKTEMAAWFVSHCETLSSREKLAKALQKHMQVDIYGKCGPMSCQTGSAKCDQLLDEKYKFYFSFENSLCSDYITEKLYNALKRNIIPVVYGGANYSQFLPPHSYINANDFDTPEELAKYLKDLAGSPKEYMRYFWWRDYYDLKYFNPFCNLCQRLNQPNQHLKHQSYENIEKWWLQGSCHFKPRIKF